MSSQTRTRRQNTSARRNVRHTLSVRPNVCTRHIPESRNAGDPLTTTVGGLWYFGVAFKVGTPVLKVGDNTDISC
jgi:hypothetical protein